LSRSGKEYNVPAVQKELESFLPSDCVLDGELYVHGPSLQTINSWIKREQPNTAKIEYHVYDCPEFNGADKPWSERKLDLMSVFLLASNCPRIVVAETFVAYNLDDVVMIEKQFVDEGFEGVIARVQNGLYTFGHRSNDLLKYKSFMDAEYKIVGYYTGVGKWADCPTWVCEMENGKQFGAPPKGSMEFRRQLLRDADSYIGKWLVVKFFAYTDDGIPQFPVGIAIRMEEDMDPLG
jgi:DNA ligase-1